MTTLAAFVCCVMMMANPVDPAAARQAAARFLQAKGAELHNEAMQAPRRSMGQTADGQEASPYYVFNATSSKGFVVVSGDDCVGDNLVLGYTDQGSGQGKRVFHQRMGQFALFGTEGAASSASYRLLDGRRSCLYP